MRAIKLSKNIELNQPRRLFRGIRVWLPWWRVFANAAKVYHYCSTSQRPYWKHEPIWRFRQKMGSNCNHCPTLHWHGRKHSYLIHKLLCIAIMVFSKKEHPSTKTTKDDTFDIAQFQDAVYDPRTRAPRRKLLHQLSPPSTPRRPRVQSQSCELMSFHNYKTTYSARITNSLRKPT